MREALALARRGEGSTRPNPPVGAVVVARGGCVGRGWHRKAGGPHAEVFALEEAGWRARGATIYVTLEPCSTWGRTGPCTERVISSGIRRVVFGVRDPHPKHQGAGTKVLRKAGIQVTEGVSEPEARELIRPFEKRVRTGLPYVTLKMAMSLDGRIAEPGGKSRWVSGPASRAEVGKLRRRVDAVLVGRRTVSLDDPNLSPGPSARGSKMPFRIVADSLGQTPLSSRILTDGRQCRTIIAVTEACPKARVRRFQRLGAAAWVLPNARGGVSLKALLERLGREGFLRVLCEGGGELAASLVAGGLVDEYLFFVAPKLLGSRSLPLIGGAKSWPLDSCPTLRFTGAGMSGPDAMLRAFPARRRPCSPA
ncbi:MAG: bifunctional diaminohydroxyphosphoribosylaminopyrimidine deaminase/5-amino-6-(5-phosphoribosylamino)uracil reductase RibD [Elusimicrobia bacterium]|nr:bifunctional diaminohydroxyphosphoribosylaminopyrimidine deaminase/5-amino-6-(5-phosphoribosylamino)uracil reductase RibD [Elusimicrobiota bacterium]